MQQSQVPQAAAQVQAVMVAAAVRMSKVLAQEAAARQQLQQVQ
jgi:hypothetical protein